MEPRTSSPSAQNLGLEENAWPHPTKSHLPCPPCDAFLLRMGVFEMVDPPTEWQRIITINPRRYAETPSSRDRSDVGGPIQIRPRFSVRSSPLAGIRNTGGTPMLLRSPERLGMTWSHAEIA